MKFSEHYGKRWRLGVWWHNHFKRHWHSTALFAWWWGVPKIRVGKITPELIAWAESTFDQDSK